MLKKQCKRLLKEHFEKTPFQEKLAVFQLELIKPQQNNSTKSILEKNLLDQREGLFAFSFFCFGTEQGWNCFSVPPLSAQKQRIVFHAGTQI